MPNRFFCVYKIPQLRTRKNEEKFNYVILAGRL